MDPKQIYYRQDLAINPLQFWAMLLDCAQIDSYGREINFRGEPLMDDNFRFLPSTGKSELLSHRRWPLYDIYNQETGQNISHQEYEQLRSTGHNPKCDFRPYFNVYFNGENWHRIYLIEVGTINELIFQGINNGCIPIVRTLISIHGKDCNGNTPGQLYPYRETILNATRWAVRLNVYQNAGITEQLLNQIERGYIGSIEQYQLAWFDNLITYATNYHFQNLGASEFNLLCRFVTASESELADWFGQQFDSYRDVYNEHFPSIAKDRQTYYVGDIFGNKDRYGECIDGQLEYLTKLFRPALITRLKRFFREYSGAMKSSCFPEAVRDASKALEDALSTTSD